MVSVRQMRLARLSAAEKNHRQIDAEIDEDEGSALVGAAHDETEVVLLQPTDRVGLQRPG